MIAEVEFQSGGSKTYVWVKQGDKGLSKGSHIRIGEGYPDDQANRWSSPLGVVRALNDRIKIIIHDVIFPSTSHSSYNGSYHILVLPSSSAGAYKFIYDFGTLTESNVI